MSKRCSMGHYIKNVPNLGFFGWFRPADSPSMAMLILRTINAFMTWLDPLF